MWQDIWYKLTTFLFLFFEGNKGNIFIDTK